VKLTAHLYLVPGLRMNRNVSLLPPVFQHEVYKDNFTLILKTVKLTERCNGNKMFLYKCLRNVLRFGKYLASYASHGRRDGYPLSPSPSDLNQSWNYLQILIKFPSIKFHENLFSLLRVVTRGQT
jgi:hypothetical protein